MKRAGVILTLALVLACAGVAQADPINDPVIIVRGGSGSNPLFSLAPITLSFPGGAGCTTAPYPIAGPYFGLPWMECVYTNMTSLPINSLVFNINSSQLPLTLGCAVLCSSFTHTPSGGTATFFFTTPIPGLPAPIGQREFAIDFINFATGTTVTANFVTPEPGTLALLGTGLLAIGTRLRKKRV